MAESKEQVPAADSRHILSKDTLDKLLDVASIPCPLMDEDCKPGKYKPLTKWMYFKYKSLDILELIWPAVVFALAVILTVLMFSN